MEIETVKHKSILAPDMTGVTFIGGRRGVGKTYLASQAENPYYVCFIDYEEKGRGIHHKLNFGEYHSIVPSPTLYKDTLAVIDNIKQDRYTVVIFDNVSHLEDAMKAEAKANSSTYAKEFGLVQSNIVSGRFGGASAVVNKLISYRITAPLYSKGVKLIVGIAHAKPFWASGGPIPNKWNILGADRWQDLSILSLILIDGDYPPVPSAIVKKEQLGDISFDSETGEFTASRRLPYRIPKCNFAEINNYLKNPADLVNPAEGEVISKEEYASYSDELTDEQIEMNKASLELQQEELKRQQQAEKELLAITYQEVKGKVQSMSNLPPPAILEKIQEEYEGYELSDILEMLK